MARAVRMGQTRTVRVFRYVVKASVEEVGNYVARIAQRHTNFVKNILNLQEKKRNLAEFALDNGPGDGTTTSLDVSLWYCLRSLAYLFIGSPVRPSSRLGVAPRPAYPAIPAPGPSRF